MSITLAQAERAAEPERPREAHLPAERWPCIADALLLGYYALAAAALAAATHPTWRVASFALPPLAQQLQRWSFQRRDRTACANMPLRTKARRAVGAQLPFLATTLAAVVVTGSLASPLLLTAIVPYLAALLMVGDRGETRALLVATAVAACGLAAIPPAWAGPALPPALYAATLALSVLGVGLLLAPFHSTVQQVRADLARTREEMASEALARARCLEQVGMKVAHELKNPLSAVKALVQLVSRDATEPASRERLQVIEKEVSRIQEILGEYLTFHRPLQELKPQRIDLGPLVKDALLVLSARADEKRVRLTSRGGAVVRADPLRLKDAVMNLVANAIEATPAAGEVHVEVRRRGEQAEIIVRDWGHGMPPELLRKLGTPFFTTREDGTGLGIVLARAIVAQHGGSLHYESAPGKGTTATLSLPVPPSPRCCDAARPAR